MLHATNDRRANRERRKEVMRQKLAMSTEYGRFVNSDRPQNAFPLNCDRITACITYWMRHDSLARLLKSLGIYYPSMRVEAIDTRGHLSRARNKLYQRCETEFVFMLEEDFEIIHETNLQRALAILDADDSISGVSGQSLERGREWIKWQHNFTPDGRTLRIAPSEDRREDYIVCDLVLNFGLFRKSLFDRIEWNDRMPIQEHEDFYYRASRSARFAYLPYLHVLHHRDRPTAEYRRGRSRDNRSEIFRKYGFDSVTTE